MEPFLSFLTELIQTLTFDVSRLAETEIQIRIALQVFLLALSAFFSSSETSLFSLSQLDLQKLRRDRHPRANTLYQLLEQPRRLIISILCGNELINVAASANMAALLITLYGVGNADWINILIMVPLLLLVGEVTPKTIAVSNPVGFSTRVVAAPLMIWVKLVTPLRIAVRFVADRVSTWLVGEEKTAENLLHIDEFKTLVTEAEEEGGISTTERTLVYNLLAAGSTEIVEIMIPRTRTQFLNADWPLDQIIERVRQYRHNRLPVYRNHQDNIIGMIYTEDLVHYATGEKDIAELTLEGLLHPTIGAPPTKKVDEMFEFFQRNCSQAAVVINEFGGVDGFITMKTVLDFIFGHLLGPVAGQHHYEERDDNRYLVSGAMKLSDFNQLTHFGIEDPRMTTIAGVLFRYLDRLPQVGDSVLIDNISMRVVALEGHRITRVEVARGVDPDLIMEEADI
ncbi:MAG: hemolysin family protein [Gammaproteobacteria bacterium]|nr:hemolysin family protein [Gammaproteobacteria bacterium]